MAGRKLENPSVIPIIGRIAEEKGLLRILEQGCGDGAIAYGIAQMFPACKVDAIDLSSAGVASARGNYQAPNLRVWQCDGYEIRGSYDVVYHHNVLEHVPDPAKYVLAGLSLLKEDGSLVFSFPTVRYWKFWGFPKYLVCQLLRKKFQAHACSTDEIEKLLSTIPNVRIVSKRCYNLFMPRRVYSYVPDSWLRVAGTRLEKLELRFLEVGWHYPFMFAFYHVTLDQARLEQAERAVVAEPRKGALRMWHCLTAGLELLGFWLFSCVCLMLEVIKGRKTFFKQE